ncbi:hypothetical protein M2408_000654 [Sphingobacterium sp. BIGb0165]|nr:hypothetical protein [Sphingobacterium sp. BIGb0165]
MNNLNDLFYLLLAGLVTDNCKVIADNKYSLTNYKSSVDIEKTSSIFI